MLKLMKALSVVPFVLALGGCQIYFDDENCTKTYTAPPATDLRNPDTGACQTFGGGGASCYPQDIYLPEWGSCESSCTGLAESACRNTTGCQAIYDATCAGDPTKCTTLSYMECWAMPGSGQVNTGSCTGLNAEECSQHNNCVAIHASTGTGAHMTVGGFEACAAEVTPPPPPPACSTLAEPACIARTDCAPLYEGSGCTCTPTGCTCQKQTFVSCTKQ